MEEKKPMKKISEEIKGGEVCQGLFGGLLELPTQGERYAKTKHTTYEGEFSFPYKVTVEEEIKPALDKKGKPKKTKKEKRYHMDVTLPFNTNGMKGTVDLHVYVTSLEEIPQRILEAIGDKLAELKIRPPVN